MVFEQKVKFEESVCELLPKTSTRARSEPCVSSLHSAPPVTDAAAGPVSFKHAPPPPPRERARVQRSIPFTSSVRGISRGREREVVAKAFLESLRRGKKGRKEAMSIWVVVASLAAVADSATIKARHNHVQDHRLALDP